MAESLSGSSDMLTKAGIILPMPPAWQKLESPQNLEKWGWESKKLAQSLFGNGKIIDSQTKEKGTFLSEFDNGTSFIEFGQYLFAPILGYFGTQIGENMYDNDLTAANAKRSAGERILNTPDRLLSTYVLMKLLSGEKVVRISPEDFEKFIKNYKPEIVKNILKELEKDYMKREDAKKILEYVLLPRITAEYKKRYLNGQDYTYEKLNSRELQDYERINGEFKKYVMPNKFSVYN